MVRDGRSWRELSNGVSNMRITMTGRGDLGLRHLDGVRGIWMEVRGIWMEVRGIWMESKTDISGRRPSRHRTRTKNIPLDSSRQRASATCIHKSINRFPCLLLSEEKKYTALPLGRENKKETSQKGDDMTLF